MSYIPLIAIPLAYLIGAFPTAYVVGRLAGHIDLRTEGDGRISAAAVYRRIGKYPYMLVVFLDIGKAVLTVFIASLLDAPFQILLLTGFVTVIGHCWSIFMRFQGGLGATAICGTLLYLFPFQLLIGMAIIIIFFIITRKSSLSSVLIVVITSIVLLIQHQPWIAVVYPLILILIMGLKRFQIRKTRTPERIKT
jgi:glycerol-3-phosphate acyltransferase PlsY